LAGGERIRGDPGPGGGDLRDEGGLARVREADEPRVGDHLEFELEGPLLTRLPLGDGPRRAVRGTLEVRVAAPSPPPLRRDEPLPVLREIAEQLPVGRQAHHRPRGHPHLEVVAVRAGLELPPAVLAPACDEPRPVVEVEERGEVLVRDEDHIPSPAAVAAVRTAPRDVFLPAETHAAVPAVARLDQDLDLVYEHVAP